jgi:hypothetical protein
VAIANGDGDATDRESGGDADREDHFRDRGLESDLFVV